MFYGVIKVVMVVILLHIGFTKNKVLSASGGIFAYRDEIHSMVFPP